MAIFSGKYKILNEKDVPIDDDDDEYELNQAPTTDDEEDDYEVQDEDIPEDEEVDENEEDIEGDSEEEDEDVEPQGEEVDDEDNYELEPDDDLEDTEENQDGENTEEGIVDEPQEEEDELEQLERELFKNLKQEEISIRDKELKQNYIQLYYNICNLSDRIETVPKREDSIEVLTFVGNKLQEIKEVLYNYTINNYHLNTYIENNKNYLLYLAFLNKISLLLDQINEKDLP